MSFSSIFSFIFVVFSFSFFFIVGCSKSDFFWPQLRHDFQTKFLCEKSMFWAVSASIPLWALFSFFSSLCSFFLFLFLFFLFHVLAFSCIFFHFLAFSFIFFHFLLFSSIFSFSFMKSRIVTMTLCCSKKLQDTQHASTTFFNVSQPMYGNTRVGGMLLMLIFAARACFGHAKQKKAASNASLTLNPKP